MISIEMRRIGLLIIQNILCYSIVKLYSQMIFHHFYSKRSEKQQLQSSNQVMRLFLLEITGGKKENTKIS